MEFKKNTTKLKIKANFSEFLKFCIEKLWKKEIDFILLNYDEDISIEILKNKIFWKNNINYYCNNCKTLKKDKFVFKRGCSVECGLYLQGSSFRWKNNSPWLLKMVDKLKNWEISDKLRIRSKKWINSFEFEKTILLKKWIISEKQFNSLKEINEKDFEFVKKEISLIKKWNRLNIDNRKKELWRFLNNKKYNDTHIFLESLLFDFKDKSLEFIQNLDFEKFNELFLHYCSIKTIISNEWNDKCFVLWKTEFVNPKFSLNFFWTMLLKSKMEKRLYSLFEVNEIFYKYEPYRIPYWNWKNYIPDFEIWNYLIELKGICWNKEELLEKIQAWIEYRKNKWLKYVFISQGTFDKFMKNSFDEKNFYLFLESNVATNIKNITFEWIYFL